jgi:hypothetical protein
MVRVKGKNWMGGDSQAIVRMGATVPLQLGERLAQALPCREKMKYLLGSSSDSQDH